MMIVFIHVLCYDGKDLERSVISDNRDGTSQEPGYCVYCSASEKDYLEVTR